MSVQCVLFSFYEVGQWRTLRVSFLPILWQVGLINREFRNLQLFGTEWLVIIIFGLCNLDSYNAKYRHFTAGFLRAYLLAWGSVSWHGWPLVSLETDRLAVRTWGGWEWGWIGWQPGGSLCQTNNWLSEQAPGLTHVLIKQKTKTKTKTTTKDKDSH